MTLEPKSRQVSFTSVIAQARDDAIREANGIVCTGDDSVNHSLCVDSASHSTSTPEQSAQVSLPKQRQEETLVATLARVITQVDDEAVVSISQSMVTNTAANMVEKSCSNRTYSLYRPFDVLHLSDRQCYVRRELIEVFHADSYAKGRVALRCKFCYHVPYADRANGSMIFPRSLSVLCTSVGQFQCHIQKCRHIPQAKKDMWSTLSSTKVVSGQAKKYWIESAKKVGLIDAESRKLGGITMKCDSSTFVADATQSGSRYTRIKNLANEILSEQEAQDQMADSANTVRAPSRKRKRIKQGGRPRLFKLPVDPRRTCPEHMKNRAGRVGVYLPEARKERIARFHSKREDRIARFYSNDVLYEVRRNKANATKRVGGRFVENVGEEMEGSVKGEAEADVLDDASQASAVEEDDAKADASEDESNGADDYVDQSTEGDEGEEDLIMASIVDEGGDMEDMPVAEVICE